MISMLLAPSLIFAQRAVFDRGHFLIVNENAMVRNAAEMSHNEFLERINNSLKKVNLNCATVAAAQNMIFNGLTNVSSAVKAGLAIKNMASTCNDILRYSLLMAEMARQDPFLIFFAEQMYRDMYGRSLRLFGEISAFVLKEGNGILMDYGTRDELLKKIATDLHIISGITYVAYKAMYYAKIKGVFRSLNPFSSFLDQDRALVGEIIRNTKYLKQ